jgi:hypothetical protein
MKTVKLFRLEAYAGEAGEDDGASIAYCAACIVATNPTEYANELDRIGYMVSVVSAGNED